MKEKKEYRGLFFKENYFGIPCWTQGDFLELNPVMINDTDNIIYYSNGGELKLMSLGHDLKTSIHLLSYCFFVNRHRRNNNYINEIYLISPPTKDNPNSDPLHALFAHEILRREKNNPTLEALFKIIRGLDQFQLLEFYYSLLWHINNFFIDNIPIGYENKPEYFLLWLYNKCKAWPIITEKVNVNFDESLPDQNQN